MRVAITGHRGLLGRTLMRRLGAAPGITELIGLGRPLLDLADGPAVDAALAAARPAVVVHCAAWTRVDECEAQPARAWRDNVEASTQVARACHRHGARLIALSTDYVFDGRAPRPYHEDDLPRPMTVYGRSKHAAEQAVQRHCPDHTLLRVAWLYGPGGPSFVHTIRALTADADAEPLRVVSDQIGNPTSCDAVADVVLDLIAAPLPGIVHATCEGEASWYDLALEVRRLSGGRREVVPCTSADFPRPAPRPANSRLENRALARAARPAMPDWREALARFFAAEDRTVTSLGAKDVVG